VGHPHLAPLEDALRFGDDLELMLDRVTTAPPLFDMRGTVLNRVSSGEPYIKIITL